MNVNLRKFVLVLIAAAPLALILVGINLKWPLYEVMICAIVSSLLISAYLVLIGRRARIRWLALWILFFLALLPFTNIVFVAIYLRRLSVAACRSVAGL